MTRFATAALVLALAGTAGLKADTFTMAGMKSEVPEGWKAGKPSSSMRLAQFEVPGEKGAAEVVVFRFPGGSGTVEQNFVRQQKKFEPGKGDKKLDVEKSKVMVGELKADMQAINGTFLSKFPPFAPNAKVTRKPEHTQLYVVFKGTDGEYYVWLMGPTKTVDANKEAFVDWLKNFK